MVENRIIQLAIARLTFLRCNEKRMVADVVRSEEFFSSLSLGDIEQIVGRRVRTNVFNTAVLLGDAETDALLLAAIGAESIAVDDSRYPPQLREIFDPPYVLFLRGSLPDLTIPLLAVVGTRTPSAAGLDAAYALSRECGEVGIPVVSGLALGIDGTAHAGALDSGGVTVAVLGSGIDEVYPRSHKFLAERILGGKGAVVSEYPPRTAPRKYHFPARNRIISGLARSVVVVEAPERSGALITADYALDQGRDLFVHAVARSSPHGEGARRLVCDGGAVVRGVADILADWDMPFRTESAANEADSPVKKDSPVATEPGLHVARSLQKELGL